MGCPNCEMVKINGILCHETGCPTSYIGLKRECKWCGSKFKPEDRWQRFCDHGCYCSYHDIPYEGD